MANIRFGSLATSNWDTMRLGFGVDTGGTFTDAVILDLDSKEVLAKAKSPTTYHDLSIGILGAIDNALNSGSIKPEDIKLVGLSTTLATNSILQGRGGEVGLIGIGWTPQEEWHLGCKKAAFIGGGYDSMGRGGKPLDEDALRRAVDEMVPEVDAIVVSGMFSVSNASQEQRAKSIIKEKHPIPVVIGHEMSAELGIYERTVTAVLNGKLLPIMSDFLESVEKSLQSRGINASVYVFKGDGSLMSLEIARDRPVETILSGPAASLMGGKALAKVDSCMVVDVGGTSTDIAYLDRDFPRLNEEGASVGNWRTRVRAIDIWTAGLGGDSVVSTGEIGELIIGPDRVVPLAVASKTYGNLKEKMKRQESVSFFIPNRPPTSKISEKERRVLEFVKNNAPCSLHEAVAGIDDVVFVADQLQHLKAQGFVLLTGLTPTDIMQIKGIYNAGDLEASKLGLNLAAVKRDDDPSQLADQIMELAITRIGEEIIKKSIADARGDIPDSQGFDLLLRAAAGHKVLSDISVVAKPNVPIVGIGAPADIFVKPLESRMNAMVIIPKDYDVGNAVGAVLSQVSESVEVKIYPVEYKYIVYSPGSSPMEYSTVDGARAAARSYAEYYVKEKMKALKATDVTVKLDIEESKFCDGYGKEMKFINWVKVKATATGKPKLRT